MSTHNEFSGKFAGPVFTGAVDNRGGSITGGQMSTGDADDPASLPALLGQLRAELAGLAATPDRDKAVDQVDELAEQLEPDAEPEAGVVRYLFGKLKQAVGPLKVGAELVTQIAKLINTIHGGA